MEKRNGSKSATVMFLMLLVIILGGYIVYEKVILKKETPEKEELQEEKPSYNVNDYITIKDYDISETCKNCSKESVVKTIEFKKLDSEITSEFMKNHKQFLNQPEHIDGIVLNTFSYEIKDNILSVYSEEEIKYGVNGLLSTYSENSLNVDLKNNKILDKNDVLDVFNISLESVYTKILNNLIETVDIDEFLLNTQGMLGGETIKLTEFKTNVSDYAKELDDRYDLFVLYIHEGQLKCTYIQWKVLEALGMGTHMGDGLNPKYQTIVLK